MESRRPEINSLLILEAGKPWVEADGDVSEAIDFLRFYAVEMRHLAKPVVAVVAILAAPALARTLLTALDLPAEPATFAPARDAPKPELWCDEAS